MREEFYWLSVINSDNNCSLVEVVFDKAQTEQIARLLQQYHQAFSFLAEALHPKNEDKTVKEVYDTLPKGQSYGGVIFSFVALALIYSYDYVAKSFSFPTDIISQINLQALGVTLNTLDTGQGETDHQVACFRHLRNCFAHGRFTISGNGLRTIVDMEDMNKAGNKTFQASCEAQVLTEVVEWVLIKAHEFLASKVSP